MPAVVNAKTGQVINVTDEVAGNMLATGKYKLADGSSIAATSTTGVTSQVNARQYDSGGLHAQSEQERAASIRRQRLEDEYGGLTGTLGAAARGFGRGLSMGLYNPQDEAAQAERDLHPWASGAGEIAGILAPAILTEGATLPESLGELGVEGAVRGGLEAGAVGAAETGGRSAVRSLAANVLSYTPAGLVSRGGAAIAEGGGLARAAAGAAFEGAAQNAGNYLSQVATSDKQLTAEGFVGAMGEGALWGGIGGGVAHGLEHGFITARSMFPRLAGGAGADAAEAAEETFRREAGDALTSGDELLTRAKSQLAQQRQGAEAAFGEGPTLDLAPPPIPKAAPEAAAAPVAPKSNLPSWNDIAGDGVVTTVHPQDLVDAGLDLSSITDRGRVERVKRGLGEGREEAMSALEPMEVVMNKEGRITDVVGGRHRLQASLEMNRPIKLRISRAYEPAPISEVMAEGSGRVPGLGGAGDVAESAAPKGAWTPQAMDDSAALAEMLGQAPARKMAPEAAAKLERKVAEFSEAQNNVRDWVRGVRGKIAKQSGGTFAADIAPVSRAEMRARQAAGEGHLLKDYTGGRVFDESGNEVSGFASMDDTFIARSRPRLADINQSMSVNADYDELISRAATAKDPSVREELIKQAADLEQGAFDTVKPEDIAHVMAARERTGLTSEAIARARVEREAKVLSKFDSDQVAKYLAGRREISDEAARRVPGLHVPEATHGGLVSEAHEASQLLGEYERTHAALVKEMSGETPAKSKELADGYEKAVADQSRKTTDRMAQSMDDAAEETASHPPLRREVAVRGRAAAAPAAKTKAIAKAPRKGNVLGKAADFATALEVLQMLGVHVPALHNLPVIGPLLGLYLKMRAARSLLGKLGGKVPGTVEAKAAARAAEVRDRAALAVDHMLGLGATVAARSKSVAGSLSVFAHRQFDDGVERPAPKNTTEAALQRMDEIASAQANPMLVRKAVRRRMRTAIDPDLVQAVEDMTIQKLSYLASKMPQRPPPTLLGRTEWKPSGTQLERFARHVRAADSPMTVFDDLARGTITPEAADTLRTVYPQLFAEAQQRLVERSGEVEKNLPYQRVLKLSMLFDVPLVSSMRPERVAAYQEPRAQGGGGGPGGGAQPPAPSGPPPNLDSLYMSPADRRAMGR